MLMPSFANVGIEQRTASRLPNMIIQRQTAAPADRPNAPEVAQLAPAGAIDQLHGLRPDKLADALGGVRTAVATDVDEARAALAQNPPASTAGEANAATQAHEAKASPAAEPGPNLPKREVQQGAQDDRSTRAVERPRQSAPQADTSPKLAMSGQAAANANEDRNALQQTVAQARAAAQGDIAQPMGEETIAPTVQPRRITAHVAAERGAAGAQAQVAVQGGGLGDASDAVGIIAQQTKGAELATAVTQAQTDIAAQKQAQTDLETQKRAQADQQVASLKDQARAEQDQARQSARTEVERVRGEWQTEADQQSDAARTKADSEVEAGLAQVETEQAKANTEAEQHIREGEDQAKAEEKKGEQEANRLEQEKKQESGGVVGWVKSTFDKLKSAISEVIDMAREAAQRLIDAAKKLATAAIERARQVITRTIQAVGKALTDIGDQLLASFPALRARFRKTMQALVDEAVATVDELTNELQTGVQAALDLLGQGIDAGLGLLEKGLHAVVDGVSAVVQGAIAYAEKVVQVFGTFAVLVKDIAADPLGWIGKLGAAVVDGIQNHLWKAFQTAITAWFNSKLLEILGIGGIVIQILQAQGMGMAAIGQMAWEGLESAIPVALISILVEKLVSMIVPAAGAVIVIIESLQAAWGTVSRIFTAIETFTTFLRAVEGGNAGPLFAQSLAAAAVVVIDFVANWLIKKLRKAAAKVGRKLKAIAKKLQQRRAKRRPGKRGSGSAQESRQRSRRDDRDGQQNKRNARKRLRQAEREIHRGLGRGMPEKRARALVRRVAARHRIKGRLLPAGKRWKLLLEVNPRLERFYQGKDLDEAKRIIQQEKKSIHEVEKALTELWRKFGGTSGRGAKNQSAYEKSKQEIAQAGGMKSWIGQQKIPDRKFPEQEGDKWERSRRNAWKQKAANDPTLFYLEGKAGIGTKGSDGLSLEQKDGKWLLAIHEYKTSFAGIKSDASSRTPKDLSKATKLPRGATLGQDLEANPGLYDKLVTDEQVVKDYGDENGEKYRRISNRFSAITKRLLPNLRKSMDRLRAIENDKDNPVKLRKDARTAIDAINLFLQGDRRLNILIEVPADKKATPGELADLKKLLEATVRRAKSTRRNVELALGATIRYIDENGDFVESKVR